ncbi:MAG: hypothetical protein ACRDGG_09710 [Anaerolineae bacterium]
MADLPYNRKLVDGPDFNGIAAGGLYMPAAQRFRGRFYAELGSNGLLLLTDSRHHVLILTPLYGLVMPSEPIQNHSCYVNDHADIHRYWTEEDRLTKVLIAYMDRYGITQVLDLTAEAAFRNLIAWESIRTKAKVLHCFGEQNAGPAVLRAFAVVAKQFLEKAPNDALSDIKDGAAFDTPYERVLFRLVPRPPAGAPEEFELHRTLLTVADELGRMRRNIIRVLNQLHRSPTTREGVINQIDKLKEMKRLPTDIAIFMKTIVSVRNRVEYEEYSVLPEELIDLREKYAVIYKWAWNEGIRNLEDV